MKRAERLLVILALAAGAGTLPAAHAQPAQVSLEDVLRLTSDSPRVAGTLHEADAARAERSQAGALPNPSLTYGYSRPSSGARTIFDANSQEQATVEMPVPIFGQRGARMEAADRQVGRAESQLRLTRVETKRLAALAFSRLLAAQEQRAARQRAIAETERLRGLVAGRSESGMASRYDLARAEAELSLARVAAQRAESDVREQAAALAGLLAQPGWQPVASGSLTQLQSALARTRGDSLPEDSPALRLARDETAAFESRVELARRERYPVPSVALGRTWTGGPFGAANYIGLTSEIPIFDSRGALVDKAKADTSAARERERSAGATLRAEYQRQRETLNGRRETLTRFEREVSGKRQDFLEMAENAYRLGRGTLFELLDARRTVLEAELAGIELTGAVVESELELRALTGDL